MAAMGIVAGMPGVAAVRAVHWMVLARVIVVVGVVSGAGVHRMVLRYVVVGGVVVPGHVPHTPREYTRRLPEPGTSANADRRNAIQIEWPGTWAISAVSASYRLLATFFSPLTPDSPP